jgi:hypothetical protein
MMELATIVDWKALGEIGLAAFVAGVGVALTFSLAILGFGRFAEANRRDHAFEAAAFAVVGVLGFLATAAAIVAGIVVMTSG